MENLPFSRRFPNENEKIIINDFPESTRKGLVHVLQECIDRGYINNWQVLASEILRLSRESLLKDSVDHNDINLDIEYEYRKIFTKILLTLRWKQVFELCERVYKKILQGLYNNQGEILVDEEKAKEYYTNEIQQLLFEEGIAFQFKDGIFFRHGLYNTQKSIENAFKIMGRPELIESKRHYQKALKFFQDVQDPDYPNSVKESVSALESAIKVLFGNKNEKDIIKILKKFVGTEEKKIPPTLINSIDKIYSFRGAASDVAHGGATGGIVTPEIAELFISLASAYICYIVNFSDSIFESDPF